MDNQIDSETYDFSFEAERLAGFEIVGGITLVAGAGMQQELLTKEQEMFNKTYISFVKADMLPKLRRIEWMTDAEKNSLEARLKKLQ